MIGPQRCSAVIFDMDGVLIDSEPIHFEAIRALLADRGIAYTHRQNARFFGCTGREVFAALKATYGLAEGETDLADEWTGRVVSMLDRPLPALPGVPAALRDLAGQGRHLALASSSAPAIVAATLKGLGLADAFECVVSGCDVQRGKPAPDIFVETARRLRVPPGACLVVEDSQNGLRAAVGAGMRCVVVPCEWTETQDFRGATARLGTLDDLAPWVAANG